MSLEDAINENTLAIRELIKHLGDGMPDTRKPADKTPAKTPDKAVEKAIAGPDFRTVIAPAFVAMVKAKGPATAPQLLAAFGIDAAQGGKLSQIPVERHAELYAAIQAASV